MGYHYFNKELIDDLVVYVPPPAQGLVYAPPASNGDLKLVAVEYVVPGARTPIRPGCPSRQPCLDRRW